MEEKVSESVLRTLANEYCAEVLSKLVQSTTKEKLDVLDLEVVRRITPSENDDASVSIHFTIEPDNDDEVLGTVSLYLDSCDVLNTMFKEKCYIEAKKGNEWFNGKFTYKTERFTPCYTYEQEDGTKESVKVLHFTLTCWDKDNVPNVPYEILFHLPYYIKTGDKEIYLPELIEGVLSGIEEEMSSIISRDNPERE